MVIASLSVSPDPPYDKGDVFRSSVTFYNGTTAVDPTGVVTFKLFPLQSGSVITKTYPADVEVVKDSTGHYHLDSSATFQGVWAIHVEGTGTNGSATELQFMVAPSALDPQVPHA